MCELVPNLYQLVLCMNPTVSLSMESSNRKHYYLMLLLILLAGITKYELKSKKKEEVTVCVLDKASSTSLFLNLKLSHVNI